MMRNPNQIRQKLGGALDPRMLQQFGGVDGMMDMMK
jgi:signal recognition particle subunit SRP54